MSENRNLILAMVLSLAVYLGWTYFVTGPQMKAEQAKRDHAAEQLKIAQGKAAPGAPQAAATLAHLSRGDALKRSGARIAIQTPSLDGSLLLKGARLDDLRLKNYRDTVDPKSPEIVLFSPEGSDFPLLRAIRIRCAGSKTRRARQHHAMEASR
ncbi:MAG: membrane protein insertase YidC [Rhizomicrobium sp.]